MLKSNYLKGIILAGAAAVSWGGLGASAQYLFQYESFSPAVLSSLRLLSAGMIMMLFCGMLFPQELKKAMKSRTGLRDIVINGLLLLGAHQSFFFAIYYSNAGTGAVFLALQPVMASLYLSLREGQKLSEKIWLCVGLATLGVILIVTDGSFSDLVFSPLSIFWGLLCSAASTAYSIQPRKVIREFGVMAVAPISILAGGIAGCMINLPAIIESASMTFYGFLNFSFIVVVGTVLAFWWYLSSLKYISPVAAGLMGTLEPLTAFLFALWFLSEGIGAWQYGGMFLVISTVFVLAMDKKKSAGSLPEKAAPSADPS